jgi:hypothetical protein
VPAGVPLAMPPLPVVAVAGRYPRPGGPPVLAAHPGRRPSPAACAYLLGHGPAVGPRGAPGRCGAPAGYPGVHPSPAHRCGDPRPGGDAGGTARAGAPRISSQLGGWVVAGLPARKGEAGRALGEVRSQRAGGPPRGAGALPALPRQAVGWPGGRHPVAGAPAVAAQPPGSCPPAAGRPDGQRPGARPEASRWTSMDAGSREAG